jgi:hypothetical protein
VIRLILQINTATTYIACIFVGLGIGGLHKLMPRCSTLYTADMILWRPTRLVNPIASIKRVFAFIIMRPFWQPQEASIQHLHRVYPSSMWLAQLGFYFDQQIKGKVS